MIAAIDEFSTVYTRTCTASNRSKETLVGLPETVRDTWNGLD